MSNLQPFVRVVVLAFDGAQMTLECITSIFESDWPKDRIEVVLVDNGSLDDVVERVRNEFPQVRLLEPMKNLGFAGGCNLGIEATQCSRGEALHPFEFVALVNNDATVSTNWLTGLIEPFDRGVDVGAVSPKMLFRDRYSEVSMSGLSPSRHDVTDRTVRITGVRIDGVRADELLAFDEGFSPLGVHAHPSDEIRQATRLGGKIRIVRNAEDGQPEIRVSVRLESAGPGRVRLRSDLEDLEAEIDGAPTAPGRWERWVDVRIGSDIFDVVNNVGSELYIDGSAGDRGFLQRDVGQFEDAAEVFAWCGGAVLLRKSYLDDVGLFDESFFLYYEDTDLAWRGRLRGWRYLYAPGVVVRHRHAQSSVVGSDLFKFQVERNRLLVLMKNAPRRVAARALVGELQRTWRTLIGDIVAPVFKLSPLRLREARLRKRVLVSFVTLLPSTLRHRSAMKMRISRRRVYAWAVEKKIPVPEFGTARTTLADTSYDDSSRTLSSSEGSKARPTAAVFNLYWDTLGGGEVVSGEIARILSVDYDVTILGPNQPDVRAFRDRLGIDLDFTWREVDDDDDASKASGDYDVFVNCTYSSKAFNRAPVGLYYVHFPRKLQPRAKEVALENGIRLVQIAARSPLKTSKFATAERLFRERLSDDTWVTSYSTFIANSNYTRRWIENIWHRDSEVINPPVRPRVIPGDKEHLIASVGRFFDPSFGHSKKQMELLTIFADMARSHIGVDDWRLSFLGGADAPSRDYVMRIRRAAQGLPIDVHVNADRIVVDDALSRASIYWHASGYDEDEHTHPDRLEHFGISIVEAMAAGAVPLVFGAGGPAEIVRNGVDGFHWHTLEQLAQLTRRLMNDESQLESMSRAARERAKEFDPTVFDQRIHDLVRSLRDRSQTR